MTQFDNTENSTHHFGDGEGVFFSNAKSPPHSYNLNATSPSPEEQVPSYDSASQQQSMHKVGFTPDMIYMPPPVNMAPFSNKNQTFHSIKAKYEISTMFGDKLQMLNGFKIVFIFDDSGSMNATLQDSPLNQVGQMKATRWDELKYFANISLEVAAIFDPQGCDVYFLNRPPAKGITLELLPGFLNSFSQTKPSGYTPLAQVLSQVLNENANLVRGERKLLIVIVTDGEPTDYSGNVNINQFKQCLQSRNPIDRIFVNIVACTDDDSSMAYLNRWDREIKHLDVVDDFRSEKEEVKRAKGAQFRFTYGDYVVKSLIGSVDLSLDYFDEKSKCCCCTIL